MGTWWKVDYRQETDLRGKEMTINGRRERLVFKNKSSDDSDNGREGFEQAASLRINEMSGGRKRGGGERWRWMKELGTLL